MLREPGRRAPYSEDNNIYNAETKEQYSIEYFLDHVNPNLDYSEYGGLIEDHIIGRSCRRVYHVDTYLHNNTWRVQIAVGLFKHRLSLEDLMRQINEIQGLRCYQPQMNRVLYDENDRPYFGMTLCFEIPYVEKREEQKKADSSVNPDWLPSLEELKKEEEAKKMVDELFS